MNALEAKQLSKSYGAVRALRQVSFTVKKGEIIGLLGPNGAGKTTLMKILSGYLQADTGEALVAGSEVGADPLAVQASIGYLPENAPLYREMTVQEYLLMMSELRSIPVERRGGLLREAVDETGLGDVLARSIGTLSKGYRQRVGLAQALLHQPEILILDEPTTGLDPAQISEIRDLIKQLAKSATILLSTHILSEVEMTCERVILIAGGQVRADSPLAELQAGNAAVIAIDKSASDVQSALGAVGGVDRVQDAGLAGDFRRWRVTAAGNEELCPALFDVARDRGWRVSELRSEARTLETVFKELVNVPAQEANQ